jgi:hypothetical protein
MNFVAELRKCAPAGALTVVSYDGLRFARECGIDIWDYAETLSLQTLIADIGTPEEKQRLKEELMASRWCSELMASQ